MDTAVIWIPADIDPIEPAVVKCLDYSRRRGYRLEGIVRGSWESVSWMVTNREVAVVIISDWAYLPPAPMLRIEVADD
ncbi:hypothetical protein [Micromonospora sp. U21]|uniref:hypothetical protein n=1 Tax=Micromonospora sp. U21 TaxID=2824899 RepID=UPI001B35BC4D|nr:hypothetical protein [Micromonospora sp. U21]MBQ0905425.1 hypothetical protein [Micromonospora sp. U21]